MPARADIDPLDMMFVIGNIILVDVLAETPLRFRIRLHGTNLVQRVGYELTGKMLDDLPVNDFRRLAQQSFTEAVTTAAPLTTQLFWALLHSCCTVYVRPSPPTIACC